MAAALLVAGLLTVVLGGASAAAAQASSSATVPTDGGNVTVLADRLEEVGPDNLLVATGNVEVTKGSQRLTADRVEVNRATGDMVAEGRVIFYDGDDQLVGERIEYNFKTGTGIVYDGSARSAPYYRIGGEQMERLGEGRYRIRRGVFTTCEDDPPAWSFRFGTAEADLDEGVYGTNASFWVKRIPVIPFVPFFAAALRRERQTGFLFPRWGSTSRKGNFVEIPFFWAISDSQDATITLDLYSARGPGLTGEYRNILSQDHRIDLSGFFLKETERRQVVGDGHDSNRGWWHIRDTWAVDPALSFRADINGVTDDFVFRDYATRLTERAAQRIDSNVFLTWTRSTVNVVTSLSWYQDLTQPRPVELQRLPDISLNTVSAPLPGLPGFLYQIESSGTHFVREVGAAGNRVDFHPRITRPIPVSGYFTVSPFVGGRLTGYDKTVTATSVTSSGLTVQETADETLLRPLVELGTDVETRAVRVYQLGDVAGISAVLHSIEPRFNYTWVDGKDLQRFDASGALRPTRIPQYDSIDALAEQSTFSYSLTNRLLARSVAPEGTEPVRWELVRFLVANSYELLNPARPIGLITSELLIYPSRFFGFRGDASYSVYGHEGFQTRNADVTIDLKPVKASLGTRYSKPDKVNFLQGTLSADVTRWATTRVNTNFDIRTDTFVENVVAVDLKWQCWAFTVEYVTRHKGETELRFAINLLGVGAPLTTRIGGLGGITGTSGPGGNLK